MKDHRKIKKHAQSIEAWRHKLNPCPDRTGGERQYIARRLDEIADAIKYHLEQTLPDEPEWLPPLSLTPAHDNRASASVEGFQNAKRGPHNHVLGQGDEKYRASNRVRVGTWYQQADQQNYLTTLIMVSPLPCDEWGAMPLTKAHWHIILPALTLAHMHWKWVHAVRLYLDDPTYEVGRSFGWYMEPVAKLTQDHSTLWTGQAIYSHIVRRYLNHVSGE